MLRKREETEKEGDRKRREGDRERGTDREGRKETNKLAVSSDDLSLRREH